MDRARRRLFCGFVAALATAGLRTEASTTTARVAILTSGGTAEEWRAEFARHGFLEGQNLKLNLEDWGVDSTLLEARARAIVASHPDLICSVFTTPSLVLSRLTRDLPIVFFGVADPDRTGLVESLRTPGRNLTGVSSRFLETVGKRLELLKEFRPHARALALVIRKNSLWGAPVHEAIADGASRIGVVIRDVAVPERPDPNDIARALKQTGADAFLPTDVAFAVPLWVQIQTAAGMPGLFHGRVIVEAGGLLSVGTVLQDQIRRGVAIAARILRGERPSRIPVDQATHIESAINLRTAEAFKWEVPPSVLLRFTEVVK